MTTALIFPGQGAQYTGMAAWLMDRSTVAAETMQEADEVLGIPLSRIIMDGPAEDLSETSLTQPAVLAVSVAMWRHLRQLRPELSPLAAAGHSLGEYTALVAAGSLSFRDALVVVRARGELMRDAVPRGTGGMVAVMGLEPGVIRRLCLEARGSSMLELACLNSPKQVVVSGHREALDRLAALAHAHGCLDVVPLDVSAPFHTPLLAPAGQALARILAEVPFDQPNFPVVQNVDAAPHLDPERIRANLVAQVSSPVCWEATTLRLKVMGARRFLEVGPGRTLCGLARQVDRRLPVLALDREAAWDRLDD